MLATADVRANTGVDMTSCLMQDIGWQLQGGIRCPDDHAADTPPEIAPIADQSVETGGTSDALPVQITDNSRVTPDDNLELQASSNDQAVLPDSGIRFSGSGGQRELIFEAGAELGNATVTVIVSDGIFTARETFAVTVTSEGGNRPPLARTDVLETLSTETVTGNVFADNGNGADSDPDGDALRVSALDGAAGKVGAPFTTEGGSELRMDADGGFRYTPGGELADLQPSRRQAEAVTYAITDGNGGSDSDSINFVVTGDPGTDQHGDNAESATRIALEEASSRVEGAINIRGDRDYFAFTLGVPADVLLRTAGDTDTIGTLRAEGGERITESDDVLRDGETDGNFRISQRLRAGTYTLEVAGFDDRATGNYVLEASASAEDNADTGDGASAGAPGSSSGGGMGWLLLVPLGWAAVLRCYPRMRLRG